MEIIKVKESDLMETVQKTCLIFTIVGAINWGLVGFFDFNLVTALFQETSAIVRIIYGIIGICGLINLGLLFNHITSDPVTK
jgi:hypothetical protein